MKLRFTILGEAVSKANSRQLVDRGDGKLKNIKSPKALQFVKDCARQIPPRARVMIDAPCGIRLKIYYRTEAPDLDESLVLDCLQAHWKRGSRARGSEPILLARGVVTNDRLFRQKHVYHGISRDNPRVEVTVWRLDGQRELDLQDAAGGDGFTTPDGDGWLNPRAAKEDRDAKRE